MEHVEEIALIRLIEERLEGDALSRVEAHLRGCAECRRRADALREEEALLREALRREADADIRVAERVLAEIYARERDRRRKDRARRAGRMVLALVAAAAAVLLAVGVWLSRIPAASVILVQGCPSGSVGPNAPILGAAIRAGDLVETARGQTARLRLGEGSILDMYELTRVRLERCDSFSARLVLDAGEIHVSLHPSSRGVLAMVPGGAVEGVSGEFGVAVAAREPYFAYALDGGISAPPPADGTPRAGRSICRVSVPAGDVRVSEPSDTPLQLTGDREAFLGAGESGIIVRARPIQGGPRWMRGQWAGPAASLAAWQHYGMASGPDWIALLSSPAAAHLKVGGAAEDWVEFERLVGRARSAASPVESAAAMTGAAALVRKATAHIAPTDVRAPLARLMESLAQFERGHYLALAGHDADAQAALAMASDLARGLEAGRLGPETGGRSATGDEALLAAHLEFFRALAYLRLGTLLLTGPDRRAADEALQTASGEIDRFVAERPRCIERLLLDGLARARIEEARGNFDRAADLLRQVFDADPIGLDGRVRATVEGARRAAALRLIRVMAARGRQTSEAAALFDEIYSRWFQDMHSSFGRAIHRERAALLWAEILRVKADPAAKDELDALLDDFLSRPEYADKAALWEARWMKARLLIEREQFRRAIGFLEGLRQDARSTGPDVEARRISLTNEAIEKESRAKSRAPDRE
ncbi:MAG: hypothetical protein N3A38_04625 [Planctomycetota bacterium]|nr:hypothetical protein [Planctomycetota bacterium]